MSTPSRRKGLSPHENHLKGLVGEGRFISYAATQGWEVFRSLEGHSSCDFVIIDADRILWRVEVKCCRSLQRNQGNQWATIVTKFDLDRFDYIFVSTEAGDYLIPAADCPKHTLAIRQENVSGRPAKYDKYLVVAA